MSAVQIIMDEERVNMQELIDLEPLPVDQLIDIEPFDLEPLPAKLNSAQRFLEPFPRDMNVPVILSDMHVPSGDQVSWDDEDSKNQ
jgi:hypothetical protein